MEYQYKAFISYRRLPLDTWAAKKVHRLIERYVVPRELRSGGKKLGRVFRDQDELALASDLEARIRSALDQSEYLIVICSPEAVKSPWVLREIDYFLMHHDRDHILAVMVDGVPETAFPPQLTELRDADGELVGRAEAIAANVVAPTRIGRERLFRVEGLRILAALIGCPFDTLFRRELRWRMRRALALIALIALIASSFVGVLLNRNARIDAQLRQTQINESRALAVLSEQARDRGDYLGALRMALDALPGTGGDRPYVAQAEMALADELNLYRQGAPVRCCSFEQDEAFSRLVLTADGATLIGAGSSGVLHVWDAGTGAERWHIASEVGGTLCRPCAQADGLLVSGELGSALYRMEDGALRWKREGLTPVNFLGISETGMLGLAFSLDAPETVSLVEIESGRTRRVYEIGPGFDMFCPAALDREETRAAFLLTNSDGTARLCLLELADGGLRVLEDDLPFGHDSGSSGAGAYLLSFTGDGDLLLCRNSLTDAPQVRLYDGERDYALRFSASFEAEWTTESNGFKFALAPTLFAYRQGFILCGCREELLAVDAADGSILWRRHLPGTLLAAAAFGDGSVGLALSDGTVALCSADGVLNSEANALAFRSETPLANAAVAGESWDSGVFAINSTASPQHACLVRVSHDAAMQPLAGETPDMHFSAVIVSETGVLAARLFPDKFGFLCQMIDPGAGAGEAFALPEPDAWKRFDRIRLTDDGFLRSGELTFDTRTATISRSDTEPLPSYLAGAATSAVGDLRAAAADGLTFTVYDKGRGETVCSGALPSQTCKLLLACGDTALLAFTGNGTLCIYDALSGVQRNSRRFNTMFSSVATVYSCAEFPEEHRLLVFVNGWSSQNTFCIALDTESWDCVGVYEGVAAWLPTSQRMLVLDAQGGLWLSPRLTLADMTERAASILAAARGEASFDF